MVDDRNRDAGARIRPMSELEEGITRARNGDMAGARAVFRRIMTREPDNEDAWLWLAWAAESEARSLEYLQQARTLLPDSERIAEAISWAEQRLDKASKSQPVTMPQVGPVARKAGERLKRTAHKAQQTVNRVSEAAQAAQQNATQTFDSLKHELAESAVPRSMEAARKASPMIVPLLSVVAIVGMVFFVFLGIGQARNRPQTVQALVLPTPLPEMTPLPSVAERTKPLWVQVDVAWTREDWKGAAEALQRIREIDPDDAKARERLAEIHHIRGTLLIEKNDLAAAQVELDQAIRLDAGSPELQKTRRELKLYTNGLDAYWCKDWPRAVENLQRVYENNEHFRDTQAMLAQAYYQYGMEREANEVWDEALTAYEAADKLSPGMEDVKQRAVRMRETITPPKRVEVDLSAKTCILYENNVAIKTFRICTGRPSAPTQAGRYQILDKIPNAYASKWDLQMPWWLGIYWAGGSENGFHALPILSNGQTLWRGSLGTGCSFGCIVLETSEAKFLYDWADIGMVVIVTP